MEITEKMAELVLQIGIILFAVRICGQLVKKVGIPSVLGELIAGVIIGPYALGGIALPGFEHGIFPLQPITETNVLAVSHELYAFATVASIVLLFVSGLETNLGLFLRYSLAGGVVGLSGAVVGFAAGDICAAYLLHTSFMDPTCLFFGVIAGTTSVGISARILSERKKMDSPEGVTILAAAVFDGVIWIILLAVVMGIVAIMTGHAGSGLSASKILGIAGKAFGIWFGVTVIGIICAKFIARFLKLFKSTFDFTILALGIALVLAGLFEKQGLAMVIGAYIGGLALSRTDIAVIILERIHGLYEFFVPIFFIVMGMLVDVHDLLKPEVLIMGGVFTLAAIVAKIIGCGGPALLLGFNGKGASRIGIGMIARGEEALITAGIGLAAGVLTNQHFSTIVFMILLTIIVAPPLLSIMLKLAGRGTKNLVKDDDKVEATWEFESSGIADLVIDMLLKELRSEGFYVRVMDIDEGISQARKDDVILFITEKNNSVTIATSKKDMPFVKNEIYEVVLELSHNIQKLKDSSDQAKMKKGLNESGARTTKDMLSLIEPGSCIMRLQGTTKGEIITELVDLLEARGKLLNRSQVLSDIFEREVTMSTGMENGVAIPHGKTDGIEETAVAIGIKKSGVYFESMDGQPSRLFILIVSPKKASGIHIQFLAAIGSILGNEEMREAIINAATPDDVVDLLWKKRRMASDTQTS